MSTINVYRENAQECMRIAEILWERARPAALDRDGAKLAAPCRAGGSERPRG